MLTIHDRPFSAVDRSEAGHWEGGPIIGNNYLSPIGTLVERQTRTLRLVHLPRSDADWLLAALVVRMQDLPPGPMRSITRDQRTAMARHLATPTISARRSTSATPDSSGNAAPTKTPIGAK
jgi:IS30 family transposase